MKKQFLKVSLNFLTSFSLIFSFNSPAEEQNCDFNFEQLYFAIAKQNPQVSLKEEYKFLLHSTEEIYFTKAGYTLVKISKTRGFIPLLKNKNQALAIVETAKIEACRLLKQKY